MILLSLRQSLLKLTTIRHGFKMKILLSKELGLTLLWTLVNSARFPSCKEYSNQWVIGRKHCLLCLFIAVKTSLVSTAFFAQSTLVLTCLGHSQHESYVTYVLNQGTLEARKKPGTKLAMFFCRVS